MWEKAGLICWTVKKAERQRIDAFELWCWRILLRVPWTARSNQLILKEINPEYSLDGLMLKLKLQYFWPPDAKNWLTGKDPDAGKDRCRRRRGRQRMRCLDGITDWWTWVLANSQSWLKPCPLSWWYHSNHLILCHPLLLPPSVFPSFRVFSNESVLASDGQNIGASASASVLPMNIQDWFPLGWTG